jgi:hypothetical protein
MSTRSTSSLRSDAALVLGALAVAAASYLSCDPSSPPSLLAPSVGVEDEELSQERLRRVIEDYDYMISDPWGLGPSEEELEEIRRRRQEFVDLLEEQ